ncbi:GNAT family N-acetyltransferase [Flavobacterium amniphilum]|uniref:GNAT family N-acetyltransferase n=1 Tax=Flavobacterium amniphilum TaxID=1834035 RepID=UPI002029F07E|nr:GNAT family N-acetyltransferase [Flavobacterium amniphilum]MCL9806630.1 GNAT family N-acetyltransferase [Flavobacterium amniphilum]
MTELRSYAFEHLEDFVKHRNNPNIAKNGFDRTPFPYTIEYATELFERNVDKNPAERFLIFHDNQLCGEIGIWLRDDIQRLNADIGYFIAEPFWGKGIATEAIRLMTEYTFKTFDVIRIVAGVFEFNKASMKALEKNGYILESIHKKGVIKNNEIVDDYVWVKFRDGVL